MPLRICCEPGCNRLQKEPRCPEHARSKFTRPNRPSDPFYTHSRWRKVRAAFLAEFPLCVDCLAIGRTVPASEVDHVLPRATHPELEWDWDNFSAKCKSCHSRKTRREQAR